MILYKSSMAKNKRDRAGREVHVSIDELPKRDTYNFKTPKERVKFIMRVEAMCRKSMEYKEYVHFMKRNVDFKRCMVLQGLNCNNGKKYTIEIHHEPFTLFDIVETVLRRVEDDGEPINPFFIADEVMQLHYDGKVGLIHLSKTMHELVHDDQIFIPLQYIYQDYSKFYSEYKPYFNPVVIDRINAKVELSMRSENILSGAIDPMFTYLDVDGFTFPEIPEEWKNVMHMEGNNLPKEEENENVMYVDGKKVIEA